MLLPTFWDKIKKSWKSDFLTQKSTSRDKLFLSTLKRISNENAENIATGKS